MEQELNGGGPCTALRIGFEGLATLYHVESETHDLEGVHDPTKNSPSLKNLKKPIISINSKGFATSRNVPDKKLWAHKKGER